MNKKPFLPFVRRGTSFFTSLHAFSFLWLSNATCMDLLKRVFCRISRNLVQNWQIMNSSIVYRCIVPKWWMIPLLGFTMSCGVLSRIFTAFSMLLIYKSWGRTCCVAIFLLNSVKKYISFCVDYKPGDCKCYIKKSPTFTKELQQVSEISQIKKET